MTDVEMKPTEEKTEEKKTEEVKQEPPSASEQIKSNVALIERAVSTFEPRFTLRVLRTLAALRKRLDNKVLARAIKDVYPNSTFLERYLSYWKLTGPTESAVKQSLLSWLPAAEVSDHSMDIDASAPAKTLEKFEPIPEVEMYFRLLLLHHLLASHSTYPKAMKLAQETAQKVQSLNRRSMDPLAAKIWYAVERAYELAGELADARP